MMTTRSDVTLTAASAISALLVTVHVADDIARQMAPGNLTSVGVVSAVVAVWLYGTFILPGRRSGYIIMILGSLLGLLMPALHMKGAGISVEVLHSPGGFFFVSTLMVLGAVAAFTLMLSVRGLWAVRNGVR